MKNLLTTYDIAQILSANRTTVIDWIEQGKLNAYRTPGGHRRVEKNDLICFLRTYKMPIPLSLQGDQKSILIVDDEKPVRVMIRRFLEKTFSGIRLEEAVDGYEAGKMVQKIKPDLVILDLHLPGINGFQVCKDIRRDPELSGTRVLAISGYYKTAEEIKKIVENGADAFLVKPFSLNTLKKHAEKLLKLHQLVGAHG